MKLEVGTERVDSTSLTAYGDLMTLPRPLRVLAAFVIFAAFAFGSTSVAGAVENPDYTEPAPTTPVEPEPEVINNNVVKPVVKPATTAAATPAVANQRLAITGAETVQMVVIGAVMVAGGAGLLVLRRRAV